MQNIFASDCLLCGACSGRENICGDCLSSLPYLPESRCRICANPCVGDLCGSCLARKPLFSRTLAIFSYEFPVDALIQSLKYRGNLALASTFANMLVHASENFPKPDLFMPVPMHPARLRERGFNQAQEMARIVSRKTGIAMIECAKIRDTPSQTSLPWKEREKNVRNSFMLGRKLDGQHVAIVDDVLTTGSTMNELSKILLEKGAGETSAWVVARSVKSV